MITNLGRTGLTYIEENFDCGLSISEAFAASGRIEGGSVYTKMPDDVSYEELLSFQEGGKFVEPDAIEDIQRMTAGNISGVAIPAPDSRLRPPAEAPDPSRDVLLHSDLLLAPPPGGARRGGRALRFDHDPAEP